MEIKEINEGLTFDDVLLVPAYSKILPAEADTRTRFSRNISLNIPLCSSAMDTVTEAGLAMALAKDIEDRWEQSRYGDTKGRPSADEIQEACRALLTIDPKDNEFPKAWAAFVRLRKIEREAAS